MNRNQLMFYATAMDLGPMLSSLEAQQKLQYTLTGLFKANRLLIYPSYSDIPDFGRALHPTAVANPSYLISERGTVLRTREVHQKAGGICFAVDQKSNEDTVVFCPAGRYGSDVILYGMVGTVSNSARSKDLYDFIAMPFLQTFEKVQEFLVGPEALALWKAGVRLTTGASTPREFDLKQ
jgi:hypothetical protein